MWITCMGYLLPSSLLILAPTPAISVHHYRVRFSPRLFTCDKPKNFKKFEQNRGFQNLYDGSICASKEKSKKNPSMLLVWMFAIWHEIYKTNWHVYSLLTYLFQLPMHQRNNRSHGKDFWYTWHDLSSNNFTISNAESVCEEASCKSRVVFVLFLIWPESQPRWTTLSSSSQGCWRARRRMRRLPRWRRRRQSSAVPAPAASSAAVAVAAARSGIFPHYYHYAFWLHKEIYWKKHLWS